MQRDRRLAALLAEIETGRLSRRDVMKRAAWLGVSAASASALATAATRPRVAAAQEGEGVRGGTLRIATIGEPPHLDEHQSTAELIAVISYCMYEGLFTYDAQYQAIPELVETHTVSEDGLIHTMKLRSGITFHNGEPLTAADAIASVERWGRISGVGKRLMEKTTELAMVDDLTIEFRLSQPYGTILIALAHNTQACTIHPKSILDAAGDTPITETAMYVGTGPYMLQDRQADAFIRFARFDGYVPRTEAINGYGGVKQAYADTIEFIPVPDEAARVAGLQAGDYHLAMDVGNDQYQTLNDSPGVVAEILPPTNWDVFFLNWKSPMMGNLTMRQAFQAALSSEPMLLSGRGSAEFIRLDPGLMMQQTPWYTTAGSEFYNIADPELAKAKLAEAGYDGTPLRFMTTQEYSYMYGEAVVAKQQLEEAGFVVDLQVSDWATVLERRAIPEEWDVFGTGHGFVPDPSQVSYVGQMNQYPGWWSDEGSLTLAADLLAESDFDTRFATWEQIQANAYSQIPSIKIGDSSICSFRAESVKGWSQQFERGVPYWNLWLEE